MRILGIDPGSSVTGYGVVERRSGSVAHLGHGTLRLGASRALPVRLATLQRELAQLIEAFDPQVVCVERVFMASNPRAALVLGHARGVALAVAGSAGLPVVEYAAREIKLAVSGSGAAPKAQVQAMVKRLLGLARCPAQDAADALATAICHAHTSRLSGLGALPARRRGRARRSGGFVVRRAR